jgi:hypothetical protein
MKRCLIIMLALSGAFAISSPSVAATLYYNIDGTAFIDPTSSGGEPNGKVFGYHLSSNGMFFVDPARTSVFPPPSQMFFENTASDIGDNDLTLGGTSNVINLGKLFSTPIPLHQVSSALTSRIYVPGLGGGGTTTTDPSPNTRADEFCDGGRGRGRVGRGSALG